MRPRAPRAGARLALALAVGVLALGLGDARAEARFALVIGHNRGGPEDAPLRFAERDAERVAEVLARLGGVPPENTLLLRGPAPADVTRALEALRARIAARPDPAEAPLLLVYYSGHADMSALRLGGQELAFGAFKAAARGAGADLTIMIVDACRSGGLLRAKGARPVQPLQLTLDADAAATGLAIITSSAEHEDAQESDHLEGSVFTHHLVTGLSGAADDSSDDRVTLGEAYHYAYTQTLAATSATPIVQHPAFAFDLRGREDVVLTRLDAGLGFGRVRFAADGHYLVLRPAGRALAAELDARAGTELALEPGRYTVRLREDATVHEGAVDVHAGATATLQRDALAQLPFRHAVRKGYGLATRRALSLGVDAEVSGELLPDTGVVGGGALTLQVDLADLAVRVRLRYARSGSANRHVALEQGLLGSDVGVYHVFDLGAHGLGVGVRAGVDWLSQRFAGAGVAPPRDVPVGRVGSIVRAELALGARVALQVDAGVEVYLLEQRDAGVGATVAPIVTLGLATQLP